MAQSSPSLLQALSPKERSVLAVVLSVATAWGLGSPDALGFNRSLSSCRATADGTVQCWSKVAEVSPAELLAAYNIATRTHELPPEPQPALPPMRPTAIAPNSGDAGPGACPGTSQ